MTLGYTPWRAYIEMKFHRYKDDFIFVFLEVPKASYTAYTYSTVYTASVVLDTPVTKILKQHSRCLVFSHLLRKHLLQLNVLFSFFLSRLWGWLE